AGFIYGTDSVNNLPFGTDVRLGPLADNGGPTKTHQLLAGSRAGGAGSNPEFLATDQRGPGFPRSVQGFTDIGAVQGVLTTPGVGRGTFTDVTAAGGTTQTLVVTYYAATLNLNTLDNK